MRSKLLIFAVSLGLGLAQLSSLSTVAAIGAGGSNGGGGVRNGAKLKSFYSAGLYVEPQLVSDLPYAPPQLEALVGFVQAFKYWNPKTKNRLLKTIIPSESHRYYKVKEDQFDQVTQDRILDEFHRVTGTPTQDLALFAITDIEREETFLLPSFYQLENPADQIAILFHENYWLLKGRSVSYDEVIRAELAFQAVYEQPNSGPRIMDLITRFGDLDSINDVAAKIDEDAGNLAGLVQDGFIPLRAIIGDELASCRPNCLTELLPMSLLRLARQYPNSALLRRLDAKRLNITFRHRDFTMKLDTPMGWVPFPNAETRDYQNSLSGFLTDPLGRSYSAKSIDLASCRVSVRTGSVGQMDCDRMDASVIGDSIRLVF